MFKEAKAGPRKAITANRLSDGLVVFLSESGTWSLSVDAAALLTDGPELEKALAYGKAQQDLRIIVDPYAIDMEIVGDKSQPARLRERIRAMGPTIAYGDAERAKLGGAAG
jgi:Protein of unknown function (DUF2849)